MRTLLLSLPVLAACSAQPAARVVTAAPAPTPTPTPAPAPSAPPPAPFTALNLGFEELDASGALPRGWAGRDAGALAAVTDERHGGARALRIRAADPRYRSASTHLDARPLAGKHVRLRGWIKTDQVGDGAVLWLRAQDGATAIDLMPERKRSGTAPWTAVAAEIDVPAGARTLAVGAMLYGGGTAWFDDLALEVSEVTAAPPITIAGAVTDAAGAPLAGAEVALIDQEQDIAQHARTGPDGRFRFAARAGTWGLSAHRAGAVGAFLAQRRIDAPADVRIALGAAGGVTVRGRLSTRPAPGLYVQIAPVSDNDADVFAVPLADDGTFEALLPRGDRYGIALLDDVPRSAFERRGDRVDAVLEVPSLAPPPAEVVAYIGERGIPLATAEPGAGRADLSPLGALIGDARVVALGEATHGTREFFQIKHRILEYLVAERGFTVFAIEANQPECRALNDYVLRGQGDPRDGIAGMYFWTWDTEEVLAMVEWMRAWNADPAHPRKVQFAGVDMQTALVAHRSVAAFLARVAPDRAAAWLAPLEPLSTPRAPTAVGAATPEARARLQADLAELARAFDRGRAAWTAAAGEPAYAEARHDLTILEQATALYAAGEPASFDVRDRAMADNVDWLLGRTGGRMVLWAHNAHVANLLHTSTRLTNMGSHLRKRHGRGYVNLGFVFGEGSFQALDFTRPSHHLAEHTLGAPPAWYASVAFSRAGEPLLVLDLRALPPRGPVHDWFWAPHPVRDTGAAFVSERSMTAPQVLPALYDAVIFVEKTTRARPLASRHNPD